MPESAANGPALERAGCAWLAGGAPQPQEALGLWLPQGPFAVEHALTRGLH